MTEVIDGSSASVGCAEFCGWCESFSTGASVCLHGVSPAFVCRHCVAICTLRVVIFRAVFSKKLVIQVPNCMSVFCLTVCVYL